ncbi:VWA domain-containing protein [Oleisolibacter albus]|uniref:VWA domain-containing protein n=1 Tax=Oleisolibacter albus TaxID=2171757 RepID=UPI000DF499A0|nr:VWA domain-containing protein [Oleisolibacter albus]
MAFEVRLCAGPAGGAEPRTADGQPISAAYAFLSGLLKSHLPPTVAGLLARPQIRSGQLEWYSDLAAQVVRAADLAPVQKRRLDALLDERLHALSGLADRLTAQGQDQASRQVRALARRPRPEDLFAVGGQPVMINWHLPGAGLPAAPAVPPPVSAGPTPASVAPASVGPAAGRAATGHMATADGAPGGWRRWLWPLLGLVLLLVLLALGLRGCAPLGVPSLLPQRDQPLPAAPADPTADSDAEIARLEQALRDKLKACPAPVTPPDRTPAPRADMGPETAPAVPAGPAPDPTPTAPPATPPATPPAAPPPQAEVTPAPAPASPAPANPAPAAKQPAAKPSPKPAPPKATAQACPPQRPIWEAPEVVLVLDASGSMGLPAQFPTREIARLLRESESPDPQVRAAAQKRLKQAAYKDSRLAVAEDAVIQTLSTLPADVSTGLVVFGDCPGTDNFKFYSNAERPKLAGVLRSIRPQSGTPLARGIERAGTIVDGRDVPAVIVVISDGEDSCGGDPCAVARALKAQKPKLKINYIDASGDSDATCIARETGGKVLSVLDGRSFEELLREAYEQPVLPPHCQGSGG